jgi:Flp pilus assembly CpaF family ATPase
LVVIEDISELQLDMPNLVRLEARREQPGLPAVKIRDLLRAHAAFASGPDSLG